MAIKTNWHSDDLFENGSVSNDKMMENECSIYPCSSSHRKLLKEYKNQLTK